MTPLQQPHAGGAMKLYNGKDIQELIDGIVDDTVNTIDEFIRSGESDYSEYQRVINDGIRKATKAIAEACTPRCNWSKELPIEIGLWWWWNEDEDSLPIVVDIAYSVTDETFFAMEGQHGWTRFQPATEMKGYWMRLHEPEPPK